MTDDARPVPALERYGNGQVKFEGGSWTIHGGEPGPVSTRLREALLDIQYGKAPDKYGWMHRVG